MNSIAKSVRTTAQIALAGVLALGVAPPTSPAAAADGALTPAELNQMLTGVEFEQPHFIVDETYADWYADTSIPQIDLSSVRVRASLEFGMTPFADSHAVILSAHPGVSPTDLNLLVAFAIDTNGDLQDDLWLENEFSGGSLVDTVTPVYRVVGDDLIDSGQPAVWRDIPSGYASGGGVHVAFDWYSAGIKALRPAALVEEEAGDYDWAPDDYEGPLTLMPLPPSPPLGVSATAADRKATITWTPPAELGSHPLRFYRVTASPGGQLCATQTSTSCTIAGLEKGSKHTFTVAAGTLAGLSPESAPSAAITIPKEPSAPLGVVAQAGDGAATVAWSSPADPGSHPVTSYTATAAPGGATCSTAGTTCTITGLVNGRAYTFTVVARSEAGSSPPSLTSAAVTPRKVKVVQEQPPPKAVVKVRARKAKSVLFVNVNPDKGRGFWKFRVQKKSGATTWKNLKAYKTQGPKETRTIDLPRGKYRVVVKAKYGHEGATSRVVRLLR